MKEAWKVTDAQLEDILNGENYGVECDEWNDTNIHDIVSDLINARTKLAALEAEKPAEDSALSAVERWADEYYERPVLVGEVHRSLAVAFQSYARSYHLAECAKCKALPEDDVLERKA